MTPNQEGVTTMSDTTRSLRRSSVDRFLGGVCGGLARYLDVDAGIVRIVTALLVVFTGFGGVLYLVAWAVLPDDRGVTGFDLVKREFGRRTGSGSSTQQPYQPYQPGQTYEPGQPTYRPGEPPVEPER